MEVKVKGVNDLSSYFDFLNQCVCLIPVFKDCQAFYNKLIQFYWFLSGPSGSILQNDPMFSAWVLKFLQTWGEFLATKSSASFVTKLIEEHDFSMSDYLCSGSWQSFNHFMRRRVKPNKRSFICGGDANILSFPIDGIFKGMQKIDSSSVIKIDNVKLNVNDIISNTSYKNYFVGGVLAWISSYPSDYQRYVMPSNGTILDQQKIPSILSFDIKQDQHGKVCAVEGGSYQFVQDRNLIVFNNNNFGFIAMVPMALVQLASVVLTSEVGSSLNAGDELGYYESGGADLLMFFSSSKIKFIAEVGKHYKQGEGMAILS